MSDSTGSINWVGCCFSVDLQGDAPVILRAERAGSRVRFSPVSADDRSFVEAVGKGVPVVGCLSVRESLTRWVEAPFAPVRKAVRVFPTLLDNELPFALEDCLHAFLGAARTTRGTTRALAVAARKTDARARLQRYEERGLDPMALDQQGLALWTQGLQELPWDSVAGSGMRALVHLAGEQSALVIGCAGEFVAAHGIRPGDVAQISRYLRAQTKGGGEATDQAVARSGKAPAELGTRPGVPDAAGAGETTDWVWVGAGAEDRGVVAGLHARLAGEWPGGSVVVDDPRHFLARALGTRALTPGPLRCNLRAGPLTHPAILRRARRRSLRTAAVMLVTGVMLCAVNVAWRALLRDRQARLDGAVSALLDEMAGYRVKARGADAMATVRREADKRMAALRPFRDAFEPSLADRVAAVAALAATNGLRYEAITMTRDSATVRGTGRDWDSCGVLAGFWAPGLEVKIDRREAGADERVPFTIATGSRND